MYALRSWSVRNARWLKGLYAVVEFVLLGLRPLLSLIGYQRIDKPFLLLEKSTKGVLMDSQSCGQCILSYTGMSCPMNCPKQMRNGPCGGVRADGKCEVDPEMNCVWLQAWEGNKRIAKDNYPIQVLQPALDFRLLQTSAWLREVRKKSDYSGPEVMAVDEV